ncbi:MAG: nitrite reductase [Flavobacteriales bacterium]
MRSFRTELENPIVQKDILELERKIRLFKEGKVDEERFRSLRLARGVYGQRQFGVQMIRIKLPFGRVTANQLRRIADVSDEYSRGRLHITTRQDIQIHHVSLDRTPELWAELEKDDVTLREACGNTVRNVTASELAGVDPNEPFDVTPYAEATFQYFLRNPICQEMGRKFKMSFSSSDEDTALSYMHDLGFIAKLDSNGERGFKVMLAGGLGSQPRNADIAFEFLPVNELLPFTEAVLRVFDRYGERTRRLKARLKFLVKDIGAEEFLSLVSEERKALMNQKIQIPIEDLTPELAPLNSLLVKENDSLAFHTWKSQNVIVQKQKGFSAVGIKVLLGDFYTEKARLLADVISHYGDSELRLTIRQNLLLRNIRNEYLPALFEKLEVLGFAELGYNGISDITACPGTDTCNLGISSSTGVTRELEKVIVNEFPQFLGRKDIYIKISGCMNACGQHNMSPIGFQGMTTKANGLIAPALQVLLGGRNEGDGKARFADKVIKVPSKRALEALRVILNDFEENCNGRLFHEYYDQAEERYFYNLLKPLSSTENLSDSDFIDWGSEEKYVKAIGVGECAGVLVDLVSTLFQESREKLENAEEAIATQKWADSAYHSYSSIINTAKAILLTENIQTNTQLNIVKTYDETFSGDHELAVDSGVQTLAKAIKKNKPSEAFSKLYLDQAKAFFAKVEDYRSNELKPN